MAVTQKGGIAIDGLSETIRALKKLDPKYRKEAINVLKDVAQDIQKRSQSRIGRHRSYRLPTNRGMIGRSATGRGAAVKLRARKFPWALAGEYGESVANIPIYRGRSVRGSTRKKGQPGFSRRTAAPLKPPTSSDLSKNRGGYWIQPTIRKRFPNIMAQFNVDFTRLIDKAMRQSGVPRG